MQTTTSSFFSFSLNKLKLTCFFPDCLSGLRVNSLSEELNFFFLTVRQRIEKPEKKKKATKHPKLHLTENAG
jgi:hypothetical protein